MQHSDHWRQFTARQINVAKAGGSSGGRNCTVSLVGSILLLPTPSTLTLPLTLARHLPMSPPSARPVKPKFIISTLCPSQSSSSVTTCFCHPSQIIVNLCHLFTPSTARRLHPLRHQSPPNTVPPYLVTSSLPRRPLVLSQVTFFFS